MRNQVLPSALLAGLLSVTLFGCAQTGGQPLPSASSTQSTRTGAEVQKGNLEFLAQKFNLNPPPEVSVIRSVNPEEYASVQAECMNAAGYEVTARSDGGTDFSKVPANLQGTQEFGEAFYRCIAQYPIDPKYYVELNDLQLEKLYAYLRDELPSCMEGRGYEAANLPSLTVFKDTYGTSQQYDAYAKLPDLTEQAYLELYGACPPTLDSSELY